MFQPQHTIAEDHQLQHWLDAFSTMGQGEGIRGTEVKTGGPAAHRAPDAATLRYRGQVVRGPSIGELEKLSATVRSWQARKQQQSSSIDLQQPCTDGGVLDKPERSVQQERHVNNGYQNNTPSTFTAPPRPPPQQCIEVSHVRCATTVDAISCTQPIVHFKALPFNVSNGFGTSHNTPQHPMEAPPPPRSLSPPPQPPPPLSVPLQNALCAAHGPSTPLVATLDPVELHQHIKALSVLSLGCDKPPCIVSPCPPVLTPRGPTSCNQVSLDLDRKHLSQDITFLTASRTDLHLQVHMDAMQMQKRLAVQICR